MFSSSVLADLFEPMNSTLARSALLDVADLEQNRVESRMCSSGNPGGGRLANSYCIRAH
jgi:hypothetical protein